MSKNKGKLTKDDLPVIEALATAVIGIILAVVAVVFRVREKKSENRLPGSSNGSKGLLR